MELWRCDLTKEIVLSYKYVYTMSQFFWLIFILFKVELPNNLEFDRNELLKVDYISKF